MSQHKTYRAGRAVGAALLGGALVIAGAIGVGAEEETAPATTISQPESQGSWTFSPDDRGIISKAGTEVRSNIESARGAISKADSVGATNAKVRDQLEQAKAGLETILDASPAVRIKSQLYAAATRIPVEDSENVVETLGEISQELSGMTTAASAPVVRGHVEAAEQLLKDGQKEAAFQALQAADEQVVLDRVDVPAAETYYLVNVAIAALAAENFQVRALAALSLVLSFCVYPLASPRFRPQVNQARVQGLEYLHLAEQAFSLPDHAAAERYLLACTRYPRCPAKGYYNLGVARERLNDRLGALEAFAQATKLKPGSPNYAAAYKRSSAKLAASPKP